jgi:hypothetical protein
MITLQRYKFFFKFQIFYKNILINNFLLLLKKMNFLKLLYIYLNKDNKKIN